MNEWQKIIISPTTTIFDSMKIIDEASSQFALVADNNFKLLGTVTDGDIRRGILRGISLQEPVSSVMNTNPVCITNSDSYHKIITLFQKKKLRQLPVVDQKNRILEVKYADDFTILKQNDNIIVLMAGGLGTRLYPLTAEMPKPMLKVGSKPILETIIESFIEHGFHQFFISVNYKKEIIKNYFGDGSKWGATIQYLDEEKQLGTAGSLTLITEKTEKPLIVMNGDILTKINFQQLLDFHEESNSIATMCVRDYSYQIPYGVVKSDGHHLLTIEEKPTHTYFVNTGIYVLNPRVLKYIPKGTLYDMPSLFETLINKNYDTSVFPIREYWLDIGRISDFEKANTEYMEVFG